MKHPLLGEIRPTEDLFRETYFTFVDHECRSVRMLIEPDCVPLEAAVALGAAIVDRLERLDHVARLRIVADLLAALNGQWNTCDHFEADGSITKMPRMPISDCQFYEMLVLDEIEVTGDNTVRLTYIDRDLFRGRDIVVTSSSGTDFSAVTVELLPDE